MVVVKHKMENLLVNCKFVNFVYQESENLKNKWQNTVFCIELYAFMKTQSEFY